MPNIVSRNRRESSTLPIPPSVTSFPYYVSTSTMELHHELYTKMVDLLLSKGLFFNGDKERREPPFQFKRPEELETLMDFTLGAKPLLSPEDPKAGAEELLDIMEFVIDYSPHASHPFMVSKNFAGLDPYGIVGDWLSTTVSHPVISYQLSPVTILMEYEVEEQFRNLLGYAPGQGDGMFTPGQGIGNSYVLQMALQAKFPKLKHEGVLASQTRAVMFVSDQADYGYEKYCIWQGIGESACVRVKTDAKGRMDVEALNQAIAMTKRAGLVPFLIVGTAGTNILGAIDPLDKIATVASEEKAWFHVDGHLAGSCIFSETQKHRLNGIERSDSCLWSPEKMLAAPFSMSIVVSKESRKFKDTFSTNADYVFDQCDCYDHDKWDNGDNTMQCTRRPDIIKIWFMWKAKGRKGLADQVNGTYENTRICADELRRRSGHFVMLLDEFDSNLTSFYYIPEPLRAKIKNSERIVEFLNDHKITETIKNRLLEAGKMEISIGELPKRKDLPKFFVMNLNNTALTRNDIVYMLDLIEYCGDCIFTSGPINAEGGWRYGLVFSEMSDYKVERAEPTVPAPPESYPDYVSAPIQSMHRDLFLQYFNLAFDVGTYFQEKRHEEPVVYLHPEDLIKRLDLGLQEHADGQNSYKDIASLMSVIRDVIYYSPQLSHPYYMFQLATGLDPYTLMADYVVACMTSPMFTYEDSPVYTLMEKAVATALTRRVGFNNGTAIPLVGGSMGNQLPILLSQIKKAPDTKRDGNSALPGCGAVFCGETGHYSTHKGTFYQGTGLDNLVLIKSDAYGKMDVNDLRQKVEDVKQSGKIPLMVCATTGTTQVGAYDPIEEIADVCEENEMWLHLDGSYGGSVIMSDNYIDRLNGVHRADSFTLNPHKMFCAARYTTIWTTKHEDILRNVAPCPSKQYYRLNPGLYDGAIYDHGETTPLTGRRPDIFKMWLLWKAKGQKGLQAHVDQAFRLTDYAHKKVEKLARQTGRFQPLLKTPPECTNINFLYIPPSLSGIDPDSAFYRHQLALAQRLILDTVMCASKMMPSVESTPGHHEHVIICLYDSSTTEADVDYVLNLIDYYGRKLKLDKEPPKPCRRLSVQA